MTKALAHNPAYLIPGDVVDGWRVVERLGSGGYGAVYVVEKEGRRCAMKFSLRRPVSEDPARTDARLFQREVVILVQLAHLSNVVHLHACGRWPDPLEGHFYIVMDYVEGDTLSAWAERHNPTPREVARLFAKLAVVLHEAHRLAIFHRDLKPENILVRRQDAEPVLLDFGAGDFSMARPLTEGPLPPGTPHYRSPESLRFLRQNRNNPEARYEFKASDDLYSLGVCLYEALTGKDPFLSVGDRPRLNMEIEVRVPPAPHEVNPRVPAALGDVVRRLMSKSPHERYPTGEALRRELEELAAQEDAAWDRPLHPPPAPKEPVPVAAVEPPTPPLPPSPPAYRARWPRGAALIGAAALASAVVIPLVRGGESTSPVQSAQESETAAPTPAVPTDVPTPPTPGKAPGEDPGPTLFASAQKEGPTVKTSDTAKSPSPSPALGKKTPSTSAFFRKCALSFGTAAWLEMGCAGAPVRPEPGDCPKGAVEAMWALELYKGEGIYTLLDASQPRPERGPAGLGVYHSGPVVSRVANGEGKMPEGTLLYGQLWMNEKERVAYGRWTEAELPGSRKRVPICLILASERGAGYDWVEGSAPGAVRLPREVVFLVVNRWP